MTILSRVFAKHGLLPPGGAPAKTFFDLSNDLGALQKEIAEIGFTSIKMWYQAMNFVFKDADEFLTSIIDPPPARAGLQFVKSPEQLEQVKNDIKDEFNRVIMSPDNMDPKSFEVTIITAVNP